MSSLNKPSKKPAPNSAPAPQSPPSAESPQAVVREDLQDAISKRAYELHLQRGSQEGSALADWLNAEQDILSRPPQ